MKLGVQVFSTRPPDEWLALDHQVEEYGFHGIHGADRLDFQFPARPTLSAIARHTRDILLDRGEVAARLRVTDRLADRQPND